MLFSEPTQTSIERQGTEAPRITEGLMRELLDGLDDSILADDAAEEDKRKELYALAASVFA